MTDDRFVNGMYGKKSRIIHITSKVMVIWTPDFQDIYLFLQNSWLAERWLREHAFPVGFMRTYWKYPMVKVILSDVGAVRYARFAGVTRGIHIAIF